MPDATFASQVVDAMFAAAAAWKGRLAAALRHADDVDDAFAEMAAKAAALTGPVQGAAAAGRAVGEIYDEVVRAARRDQAERPRSIGSVPIDDHVVRAARRAQRVSERWDEVVRAFKKRHNRADRAAVVAVMKALFEAVQAGEVELTAAASAISARTAMPRNRVCDVLRSLRIEVATAAMRDARKARQ